MGLRAVGDPHALLSRPEPSCLLSLHVTAQDRRVKGQEAKKSPKHTIVVTCLKFSQVKCDVAICF